MPIRYEQLAAHVAAITIDRPEARNALDRAHHRELAACWARFRDDDDVRVAIIRGTQGAFYAGADLKEPALGKGERPAYVNDAVLLGDKIDKPIIAAVDGPCLGGGMVLLSGTDIRFATPRARFGCTEPRFGMIGQGAILRLGRQLTHVAAMELLLTAQMVDAERAHALGLVNAVVAEGELLDRALQTAEKIAANAPLAIQATKAVLTGLASLSDAEARELEASKLQAVLASEDAKEGPRAFAERRAPMWRGR
jgi:enoyl-CoA hydratase